MCDASYCDGANYCNDPLPMLFEEYRQNLNEALDKVDIIEPPEVTDRQKLTFISLLTDDDPEALEIVAEYWRMFEESQKPQEHVSQVWNKGVPDANGFYSATITHNLDSTEVVVSVDSLAMWSYSLKDEATVVVVSPESLFGCEVVVKRKG